MKIIKNGICYIEIDDIRFLGILPPNFLSELKICYSKKCIFQKFVQKDAVNFFQNNYSIINYESLCDLSMEQLERKINEVRILLNSYEIKSQLHSKEEKDYTTLINNLRYILISLEKYYRNKDIYDSEVYNLFNFKQKRL